MNRISVADEPDGISLAARLARGDSRSLFACVGGTFLPSHDRDSRAAKHISPPTWSVLLRSQREAELGNRGSTVHISEGGSTGEIDGSRASGCFHAFHLILSLHCEQPWNGVAATLAACTAVEWGHRRGLEVARGLGRAVEKKASLRCCTHACIQLSV